MSTDPNVVSNGTSTGDAVKDLDECLNRRPNADQYILFLSDTKEEACTVAVRASATTMMELVVHLFKRNPELELMLFAYLLGRTLGGSEPD